MLKTAVGSRSLVARRGQALDGWMDDDVASAATQLFGPGPSGMLVIDARELLTSTARVVGAQMGELHLKLWMALVTHHVAEGLPENAEGASAVAELGRIVWGADRAQGGDQTKRILRALFDLYRAEVTVPGYDTINQCPAPGVSSSRLLIDLHVDEAILQAFEGEERTLTRSEFGRALGSKYRGTVKWRLHPVYADHLAGSDLRRFDWAKAQQLRGVALSLWMVFTSPRIPYRASLEDGRDMQFVDVALTAEHYQALGVRAATDAARRRTLNEAGRRVCAADKSFTAFEARGGRGRESFLRIVRAASATAAVESAADLRGEQLVLDAA